MAMASAFKVSLPTSFDQKTLSHTCSELSCQHEHHCPLWQNDCVRCGLHAQVRAGFVLCGSLQLHKRKELPKWNAVGTESNLLQSLAE